MFSDKETAFTLDLQNGRLLETSTD